MKLRIIIANKKRPAPCEELPLFNGIMVDRRPKLWALASSLAGHVATILVCTVVAQYVQMLSDEARTDWSTYRMETLNLRLAQPLYFTPDHAPQKQAPPPQAGRLAKAAPAGKGVASTGPQVQLPVTHAAFKHAPVILQPEIDLQAPAPPAAVPPLAFWARQSPDAPKPPRSREAVVPGRTEAPSPAPVPAAKPVLAVPNREVTIADTNVAMPQPQSPNPPRLAVANSATVPVRLREATESRAASFDTLAGQPVNVLALAAEPLSVREVRIPKGFQNAPPSAGNDGSGTGAGSAKDLPAGRTNTEQRDATAQNHSAAPGVSSPRESSTAGNPADRSRAANQATGNTPPIAPATTASNSPARTEAAPGVIRIQHPANGNFDVVLMQSSVREDRPDTGFRLTGNPVYSVYLHVGDQREWVLEYCAPAAASASNNPYEITVDSGGAITPPYPVSTAIPGGFAALQNLKQTVLRGLLSASGTLRITGIPETGSPLVSQLVALVNQWLFRPAQRDKKPIDIEVLLVIPSRASGPL